MSSILLKVNDQYGHDIGDKVLNIFVNSMIGRIRNTDIFGRWGGDEFLLICPNTDSAGLATLLGDRRGAITKEMGKTAGEVGFSYGISEFKETDIGLDEFLKRADTALYNAKKQR